MSVRDHRMTVPAAIPAVLLRVVLAAVAATAVFVLVPFIVVRVLAVVAVLLGAILPRTLATWASVALIGLGVLAAPPDAGTIAVAVLAVHVIHVLASVVLEVPARSRIALRALRPTLIRFLVVQAAAQPLALLLALLAGADTAGMAWAAPVGAVVLAALAVAVLRLRAGDGADVGGPS